MQPLHSDLSPVMVMVKPSYSFPGSFMLGTLEFTVNPSLVLLLTCFRTNTPNTTGAIMGGRLDLLPRPPRPSAACFYLHYREQIFHFVDIFESLTDFQESSGIVRPEGAE